MKTNFLFIKAFGLFLFFMQISMFSKAQAPKAFFISNFVKGCAPLVVQFTDQSTNIPSQWLWDLGNGTTSTEQNPSTVYNNPGTYTITLTVTNSYGTDTYTRYNYITADAKPAISFASSVTQGCIPLGVQFNDNSIAGSGTILEEVWDFGDGNSGNGKNPSHVYTLSNSFSVALTVINSSGCKATLQQQALINIAPVIKSDFTYSYANACQPPTKVTFNNLSSSQSSLSYSWSFGDGNSSVTKNPVNTYAANGNYNARLIAKSIEGCADTISKTISVGSVIPDFSISPDLCAGERIDFMNTSTPSPKSATWSYGNGQTGNTLNGFQTYTTAGTYTVKMTGDFGACSGMATHVVTITDKPKAFFSVKNISSGNCGIPLTVNFINNSTGAINYKWLFGDDSTSLDNNPTHTYVNAGSYAATLIAFNTNGCSDTITIPNIVIAGPPKITGLEGIPYSGCIPATVNFKADILTSDSIISYKWSFGDGTESPLKTSSHNYPQVGSYTVKLTVMSMHGCTDSFTMIDAVKLGIKPKGGFSAVPNPVCGNATVRFTDTSKGLITDWHWFIGKTEFSAQQNPAYVFNDTGYVAVTLITGDNGCYDTVTVPQCVYIIPPIAKYVVKFNCSKPFERNFIDSSISPKTWLWEFGDGQTSSYQNPVHTFSATGIFTVKLTITDSICTSSKQYSIYIVNEKPSFSFSPPATTVCKGESILFNAINYHPQNISGFNWNFGDGNITGFESRYDSIYHSYTANGNFTPQMISKDINGCYDTVSKPLQLKIYGPTAAFANTPGICLNSNEIFTDHSATDSIHTITQWTWNFGDGNIKAYSAGPFQHKYNSPGIFDVTLTVTDTYGCKDSLVEKNGVEVDHPVADFSLMDSVRCSQNDVSFINNSSGNSLTYLWYSGDGRTFGGPYPAINYPVTGVYTIALKVVDKNGCADSISKPNIITISNPQASFILTDTFATCPPLIIQPANTSKNYSSDLWNFGDNNISDIINPSHTYNEGGVYMLKLIVQGHGACYDSAFKKIILTGPSGTLAYTPVSACMPAKINFIASSKGSIGYIWDFNNGVTKITADSVINYSYNTYGNYLPKLILEDQTGCKVSITAADTLKISDVKAEMRINASTGCDSSGISFTNTSVAYNNSLKSFTWNFGDGNISTEKDPSHFYINTGDYKITLTAITDAGCINTDTVQSNIRINKSPEVSFSLPDSTCINNILSFSAIDETNDTAHLQWKWNLGNGIKFNTQNALAAYNTSGIYTVGVAAEDDFGCYDSAFQNIYVLAAPKVNAGADTTICMGASFNLHASGAINYTWRSNAFLSCINCNEPVANPDTTSVYYLTGDNFPGCAAEDSVIVFVKQPFKLVTSALDTLCNGESIMLHASGAELYQWLPAEFLNDPTQASPVFHGTVDTAITYTLIGKDDKNCFEDTAFVKVKVNPVPKISIQQKTFEINLGQSVQLDANTSPDATSWKWTPALGLDNALNERPLAKPEETTTYTVVASNGGACISRDQVTITVICNGDNIFVPNTFSPNGDGMNDIFYLRSRATVTVKSMLIFNRLGQVVFQKNNITGNDPLSGWDGTLNGKKCSSDVYVYIMQISYGNENIFSVKGNVALLR